jgi:hypothetical protein
MAKFNEILAGRYNRYLQKLFQLKGTPPAAQLASEVMPVFQFFTGVENRYLEGWNRFGFVRAEVAVAAIQSTIRLRNPLTSNIVAIFERLLYANTVADQPVLREGPTNTDLPTVFVVGNKRLDPRGSNDSQLITSENSGGGGVLLRALESAVTAANGSFDFVLVPNQEILLLPGEAIDLGSNNVNQAISGISFLWRERALEDSELK